MKTMKMCFALIGAASILSSNSLFADITISYPAFGPGADSGGAFLATDTGGQFGTFLTFCVEENQYIGPLPATYSYVVNSGSVPGGVGTAPDGTPGVFDPLSIGTAYLYSSYRTGGLASFGWNDLTLGNAMQSAIWWLEDEKTTITTDGLALINYASSSLGIGTNALTYAAANGAFGVVVLNLYNADGSHAQDQLALVPEPSTVIAGALLLLPLGISALRIVRKNRTA